MRHETLAGSVSANRLDVSLVAGRDTTCGARGSQCSTQLDVLPQPGRALTIRSDPVLLLMWVAWVTYDIDRLYEDQ
jgi:hypothetical protein